MSPTNAHLVVEVFKESGNELFKITDKELGYSNFISEEWKAICSLAGDELLLRKLKKNITWWFCDRGDYLLDVERQLKDEKIYKPVTFIKELMEDLTECSNMFNDLKRCGCLSE